MRKFLTLITVVSLIGISFISFNLGMDWIQEGYGLNPYIAFPIAAVFFIAGVLTPRVFHYWFQVQDEMQAAFNRLPLAYPTESEWSEFVDAARAARQSKLAELQAGINRSNEYIAEEAFRRLNSTEY